MTIVFVEKGTRRTLDHVKEIEAWQGRKSADKFFLLVMHRGGGINYYFPDEGKFYVL